MLSVSFLANIDNKSFAMPVNFRLLITPLLLFSTNLLHAQASADIHINQEGYYPAYIKKAVVTGVTAEGPFFVIRQNSKDTVFKGVAGALKKSKNSSLYARILDFTTIQEPGLYNIVYPPTGISYPVIIKKHSFQKTAKAALKGYYFQRVSMPLEKQFAGQWNRVAGHPDTAVEVHPSAANASRPAGTIIQSPGGWYDAGDYNKYIVNSGITMGTLLSAYEDFSGYFDTLNLHIPESGNALPDILDETIYNLRWMLTMQDPADGGVYHKCTNANFDGMVMPGITRLPRYVVQKSTAAALDFTAVMAQASRILNPFKKELPGLADSCHKAAELAWNWAIKNPAVLYSQDEMNKKFKPEITTGAYGDNKLSDEWFWAASEMYINTGLENYRQKIIEGLNEPMQLASWSNVAMAGYYSLVRNERKLPATFSATTKILRSRITGFADSLLINASTNAFHTVMGGSVKDFEWGSNAVAANQGIVLINAYLITKNAKYLEGALSNADYILGRNATGYCFVTGAGIKYPMRPHHRQSVADGIVEPVPGLLSGGPNPGKQDNCIYAYSDPETSFVDNDCSYASNEIAINWNAPLAYLLNGLEFIFSGK
jgi:endoglucanase